MIRLLPLELLLIFVLQAGALARQEALSFHTGEPMVRLAEGSAERVEIASLREPLRDWPGFRLHVRVTNHTEMPVSLTRIDLLDHAVGNPSVRSQTLRVLTFDQRGQGDCRVLPLLNRLESSRFLAAALPGRAAAVLAGFVRDGGGISRLAIEPQGELLALSAWLEWTDQVVLPGQSFVSPELLVFFSHDGLIGLEWLFEQLAKANDPELPSPFKLNALLGAVGSGVQGQPLDLFASDGEPSAWRLTGEVGGLLLVNGSREVRLSGATFRDLHLKKDGLYRITGLSGPSNPRRPNTRREFGIYRRGVVLPLAARSRFRLQAELVEDPADPAEQAEQATGFELLLIRAPDPELPATRQTVETNHPDLHRLLAETLNEAGAVIANHRGAELLELLPPALEAILKARIIPYRPERVTAPGLDEQRLFAVRASNLEWSLDFPNQESGAGAWLVSPEAGLLATPLQPVLADGFFAGRGFALRSSQGLVLITMDLSPAELDALVSQLLDQDQRFEAMREAALARNAVNKIPEPSGLFRELGLERYRPFDLAPANPAATRRWSVLIPGGSKRIRHLLVRPGQEIREQVLNLGRRMSLGIDTVLDELEQIVIVVRRAPEPSPTSYWVEIDNVPLGSPVAPRDEDRAYWQEDVWLLSQDLIQQRGRVALSVLPAGGTLALARIGFFRHKPKPGVHLSTLDPLEVQHDGQPPIFSRFTHLDRSASGQVLRIGQQAFLQGVGCIGTTRIEYALNGRYETFLARAGVAAQASEEGSSELLVLVDGEQRFRSEPIEPDQDPVAITVNVSGARRLVLQVIASQPDCQLNLVEARFSR